MLDYWVFIAFPVTFSILEYGNKKVNQLSFFFVALIYILFIGLRDEVGPDWFAYFNKYTYLSVSSYAKGIIYTEPGFATLNWVVAKFDGGIYFVNGVIAVILVSGVVRLAKLMPFPWVALISVTPYLVIVIGMSASRQAAAIGIVFHLIAIWIKGAGLIKKVLYSFVAITFHYSAILSLLFILQSIKIRSTYRMVILAIGGIASYPILTSTEKYSTYEQTYLVKNIVSSGALMHASLNAIPAVIYFLYFKKFKFLFAKNDLVFFFAILSIISVFGVSISSTAVDRLALYLSPIQMFIYGTLPLIFNNQTTKLYIYFFIVFIQVMIMVVWFNFASHVHGYVPYKSILY